MDRKPRRRGCLPQLLGLLMLGLLVWIGVTALTHPWIYTVGGRMRLLPFWQGVAEASGPGGDYKVYISLEPRNAGQRILPETRAWGSGWVCAPGGHDYKLIVSGSTDRVVWRDMDGRPFGLRMWSSRSYNNFSGYKHLPPVLNFEGRWDGDGLTMNDKGSFAATFNPDGTLPAKPGKAGAPQPIRFVEHDWWMGDPCR